MLGKNFRRIHHVTLRSKIRNYLGRRLRIPEIPFALEQLCVLGFHPSQVFDVGAYRGDFALECLRVWPDARVTCFEPLEHKVVELQRLASRCSNIRIFPYLLGAQNLDQVPFHESETASSILVEHIPQNFPVRFHPMRTVDKLVEEHFNGTSPDLLKLDTQGYEFEVLKGAEKSLSKIKVILAEINFLDIHQNVPLLAEIVAWLNDRDWVAYDICGLTRRPLDQALWQADFIFTPRNSFLRMDKCWTA